MKICLVHEEYPEETNFGGIATYQKCVAEELVRMGNTVYVVTRGLEKDYEYQENGVNVIRVHVKNTDNQINNYITYRKKVAKVLKGLQDKEKIELIEVPDWGAETIFFENLRKIPLVVRLHTPLKVWLKFNKNDFGPVKDLMLKWEEQMLASADLVTCCSNALKRIILKDFKMHDEDIIVTPNPANVNNFYIDKKTKKENKIVYVGSLEQRKGVCVLAKSLNRVFRVFPDLKIEFIGKDTNRNYKNISTVELIYKLVKKKYHSNIVIIGQIPNEEINSHLNSSLVAVFPSLFDNFPYVVLEAMAAGLHIVGSRNSGMVEMLNNDAAIYKTGSPKSLAQKIIEQYNVAIIDPYNMNNYNRLLSFYSSNSVCTNLIKTYEEVKNKYISKQDLSAVLNNITDKNIVATKKEYGGVANIVYLVKADDNSYIIKKYNYDYDFGLANKLYDIYEKNGVNIVRPINKNPIKYQDNYYNIFRYLKKDKNNKKINIKYLKSIFCLDKKINADDRLLNKCNFYYNYLLNNKDFKDLDKNYVSYVINTYQKVKNKKVIKGNYLNHGDISKSNILVSNGKFYLIDFDEVTISSPLYDFAVITVKIIKDLNSKNFMKLKNAAKKYYVNYSDMDFYNIIRFYLCKILLEKIYLHSKAIINLNSQIQKKDNYLKYLDMLKKVDSIVK